MSLLNNADVSQNLKRVVRVSTHYGLLYPYEAEAIDYILQMIGEIVSETSDHNSSWASIAKIAKLIQDQLETLQFTRPKIEEPDIIIGGSPFYSLREMVLDIQENRDFNRLSQKLTGYVSVGDGIFSDSGDMFSKVLSDGTIITKFVTFFDPHNNVLNEIENGDGTHWLSLLHEKKKIVDSLMSVCTPHSERNRYLRQHIMDEIEECNSIGYLSDKLTSVFAENLGVFSESGDYFHLPVDKVENEIDAHNFIELSGLTNEELIEMGRLISSYWAGNIASEDQPEVCYYKRVKISFVPCYIVGMIVGNHSDWYKVLQERIKQVNQLKDEVFGSEQLVTNQKQVEPNDDPFETSGDKTLLANAILRCAKVHFDPLRIKQRRNMMSDTADIRAIIASRIRKAREMSGLSQGQAAKMLELHRPSVTERFLPRRLPSLRIYIR